MKFRTVLLTAGLAYMGYKYKEQLAAGAKQTVTNARDLQEHYEHLRTNLNRVLSFQEPVKELVQDLTYKLRVYQESIAPNISTIQKKAEHIQATLNTKKS